MNLKIVMVEGPHDGAFISRVMQMNGYKTFSKHIGDYQPRMMAEYLIGQYKKAPVEELNLQNVRQQILVPSYALALGDELMLIFHMGGDGREDRRKKLVTDLRDFFLSPAARATGVVKATDAMTFIYEFDADKVGVDNRLLQVNKEIRQIDAGFPGFSSNFDYVESNRIRWGVFIFADVNGQGKLEDIVLPMMEDGNEDIARCAKDYVDKRDTFVLFQREKSTKDPQKAQIGVMGQLQKAGSATPAIIEQSAFLNEKKIKGSAMCGQLFSFLAR